MSTSGTVSFTVTSTNIITYAVKLLGKLADQDTLTTSEYSDCLFFLNSMVKQWIANNDYAPGIKMWTRQRGYCFLNSQTGIYSLGSIAGSGLSYWTNNFSYTNSGGHNNTNATTINVGTTTAANNNMQPNINAQTSALAIGQYVGIELDNGQLYWTTISTVPTSTTITIPTGIPSSSNNVGNVIYAFTTIATPPQVIENAVLRDAQGNDTPIESLTLSEYMSLPSKQAPFYVGDPIGYYYEPHLVGNSGQGYGLLHTDVGGAQDVSKYIVLSYISEIQDFVNPTDEMYFPKEWGLALIYGLANVICPMFNATWTEQMEQNFNSTMRIARNAHNKRTTMGFNPGYRSGFGQVQWR